LLSNLVWNKRKLADGLRFPLDAPRKEGLVIGRKKDEIKKTGLPFPGNPAISMP
jgi:hypothetical protein